MELDIWLLSEMDLRRLGDFKIPLRLRVFSWKIFFFQMNPELWLQLHPAMASFMQRS